MSDVPAPAPPPTPPCPRWRLVLALWVLYVAFCWPGPGLGGLSGRHLQLAEAMASGHRSVGPRARLDLSLDFAYPDGPEGRGVPIFAPGPSLLAVPVCWVVRLISPAPDDSAARPAWRARVVCLEAAGVIALLSALPAALTALLLLDLLTRLDAPRPWFTAAAFGACTSMLPLAGVIQPNGLGLLCTTAAIRLAFGGGANPGARAAALSGALAGAAVLMDLGAMITQAIPMGLCAALRLSRRSTLAFAGGAVAPAVALCAWNWASYGGPLRSAADLPGEINPFVFHSAWHVPGAGEFLRLLVSDRHGLLSTSPLLLLGLLGLPGLARRDRVLAALAALLALSALVTVAGLEYGHSGQVPGNRYLLPAVLGLALALPWGLARAPRTGVALAVASALIALCVAQTPTYSNLSTAAVDVLAFAPRVRIVHTFATLAQAQGDQANLAAMLSPLVALPALGLAAWLVSPALPRLRVVLWAAPLVWALAAVPRLVLPHAVTRASLRAGEVVRLARSEEHVWRLADHAAELRTLGAPRLAADVLVRAVELGGGDLPSIQGGVAATESALLAQGDLMTLEHLRARLARARRE